eukprot:m.18928 g.18928  ORF g.18928 m.18928 type:complete len:1188 (-) comp5818_c1_seq1:13-3576(-)
MGDSLVRLRLVVLVVLAHWSVALVGAANPAATTKTKTSVETTATPSQADLNVWGTLDFFYVNAPPTAYQAAVVLPASSKRFCVGPVLATFGGLATGTVMFSFSQTFLFCIKSARWLAPTTAGTVPSVASLSAVTMTLQQPAGPVQAAVLFGGWTHTPTTSFAVSDKLTAAVLQDETLAFFTLQSSGTKPGARYGHAAVVVNEAMFVAGGFDENGAVDDNLHKLDSSLTWTSLRPSVAGTFLRAFAFMAYRPADSMLVFGGGMAYNGKTALGSHLLDVSDSTIAVVSDTAGFQPTVAAGAAVTIGTDSRVVVFGGSSVSSSLFYPNRTFNDTLYPVSTAVSWQLDGSTWGLLNQPETAGYIPSGATSYFETDVYYPVPSPRQGHTLVAAAPGSDFALLFGGLTLFGNTLFGSIWVFSSSRETDAAAYWSLPDLSVTNSPTPQLLATVGSPGGNQLLVLDGFSDSYYTKGRSWLFDLSTEHWFQLQGEQPPPRGKAGSCQCSNGMFYVLGGIYNRLDGFQVYQSDVWAFDHHSLDWTLMFEPTNKTVAAFPSRANGVAACANHSRILWFGGNDAKTIFSDTWNFNTQTGQWRLVTVGSNLPPARVFAAGGTLHNDGQRLSLYVFGGRDAMGSYLNDMWMLLFDDDTFTSGTWVEVPQQGLWPPPSAPTSMTTVAHKTLIFVPPYLQHSADNVWLFRVQANKWELVKTSASPSRVDATMTAIASHDKSRIDLYRFGGKGGQDGVTVNDVVHVPLSCAQGHFSQDFVRYGCLPAPPGTYVDSAGATAVVNCPNSVSTATAGSTDISQCNVCDSQTHCHGHGDCVVLGDFAVSCHCQFAYRGSANCQHAAVAAIFGGVFAALILGALVAMYVRRTRRRAKGLQELSSATERLLDQTQRELQELVEVWHIEPSELKIIRTIAEGSYGVVMEARWRDIAVAVKRLRESAAILNDRAQDLFESEAAFLRTLRHENIVLFFGAGVMKHAGATLPFLVTEWVENGSLQDVLADATFCIDRAHLHKFSFDAASGLEYLHSLGKIHRDVKSANLLVKGNTVKVADFGTSRLCQQAPGTRGDPGTPTRTKTGASGTTLLWACPEALQCLPCGKPMDVYSFGIVMWEILTRKLPFEDVNSQFEIIRLVVEGQRPPIPPPTLGGEDVSPAIALMVECWAQNPRERPTFKQVVRDLRVLQSRV